MTTSDTSGETQKFLILEESGLEDVIGALLRGVRIKSATSKSPFVLINEDSIKLLAYYARRRELWAKSKIIQSREIDDIVEAVAGPAPNFAASAPSATATAANVWRLVKVTAHRFGGLHRHCGKNGEDPETFTFDIEHDVTLISGFNGAGKTALQSSIMWCLTGKALRSQHMPDEIHEPMNLVWQGDDSESESERTTAALALPPIVPIPSSDNLQVLGDAPRIDTWVALNFQNASTGALCVVKRTIMVGSRGAITIPVTGLENLGLTELAIEAGTLLPGIAAHMRFDEKTTFSQAVAQLTGLKPLEDLGVRSKRVAKRLRGDETDRAEASKTRFLAQFVEKSCAIRDAWTTQTALGSMPELIAPTVESKICQSSIAGAKSTLTTLQAESQKNALLILGKAWDLSSQASVENALRELVAANDALKPAALASLPSVSIIKQLASIDQSIAEQGAQLIRSVLDRAEAVDARQRKKREAARWQLYAAVAAWHRANHPGEELRECPLCGTDLESIPRDALVDLTVKEAFAACSAIDSDASKDAKEWLESVEREFLDRLLPALRVFADVKVPDELLDVYAKAYVEELSALPVFGKNLQSIRANAKAVWQLAIDENPLPLRPEAAKSQLPGVFQNSVLQSRIRNIESAISLAQRKIDCAQQLQAIRSRYFGIQAIEGSSLTGVDLPANILPITAQIEVLRSCVQNSAPIASINRQLDELEQVRLQFESSSARVVLLRRSAHAVDAFSQFTQLVFDQVTGLIEALDGGTKQWLNLIYRPHYVGGPTYVGFNASEEKGIGLLAGMGAVQIPAHHVLNASFLRACVWSFVFSLWEHVQKRVGGLDIVLLDDPQAHFDPMNAENLASAIPKMPGKKMRPIVTSNDHRFLASVREKLPRNSLEAPTWCSLILNPISTSRLTAGLSPNVEEVIEREAIWKEDENNVAKAQDFVHRVRVFIENRLWDLLAGDPIVLHKPTLSDLVGALRSARRSGERPFEEPPFQKLLAFPGIDPQAKFYEIINRAHHQLQSITPMDAQEVSKAFMEFQRLIRSALASYARFMGRLTREDEGLLSIAIPNAPDPIQVHPPTLAIVGRVAARGSTDSLALGPEDEPFVWADLGPLAFVGIRSPGLAPFVLQGQIGIIALDREPRDGEAVVAECGGRLYARRLSEDRDNPSRIVLFCDRTATERVPPSIVLPRSKTRLMPLVGVLYEEASFQGSSEAIFVDAARILERKLVAARIADDSAYPVMRNGDLVLLEEVVGPSAADIAALEDRIVAVVGSSAGESVSHLKRMGPQISPGVRILDSVGVKGRSVALSLNGEAETAGTDYLVLQRIWRVHGTIRTASPSN